MAYLISQLRKNSSQRYMQPVPNISATTITSPNTFGGSDSFEDFALSGEFSPSQVYYLRFKIHRIPQYFYSGSKTAAETGMYVHDADNLNLQILLKNSNDTNEQTDPPEIIGTCTVPISEWNQDSKYSSYSFVFTPSRVCNRLGFRINRVSFDAINQSSITGPRNWLTDSNTDVIDAMRYNGSGSNQVPVSTRGDRIVFSGEDADICTLVNLVEQSSGWLKIGYQSRPGSLIVVNGEPIRLGRSGIYEINNGTIINSFMIASPGGSTDQNKIDAFLLDYAYKTT